MRSRLEPLLAQLSGAASRDAGTESGLVLFATPFLGWGVEIPGNN